MLDCETREITETGSLALLKMNKEVIKTVSWVLNSEITCSGSRLYYSTKSVTGNRPHMLYARELGYSRR